MTTPKKKKQKKQKKITSSTRVGKEKKRSPQGNPTKIIAKYFPANQYSEKLPAGILITLEGGETSGKTTLSRTLAKLLKKIFGKKKIILTQEPKNTSLSIKLWNLIEESSNGTLKQNERASTIFDFLLFIAGRIQHFNSIIRPALKARKIIICDRYIDSTSVYQGGDSQEIKDIIDRLHQLGEIKTPDLTFILYTSYESFKERIKKRKEAEINHEVNHLDLIDKEKFELINSRYHQLFINLKKKRGIWEFNSNEPKKVLIKKMIEKIKITQPKLIFPPNFLDN